MKQYPIFNPESSVFVNQELVTPWEVTNEQGEKYLTSALKTDKDFDLIGLSLTNQPDSVRACLVGEIGVEQVLCSIELGSYRQVFSISSLFEFDPVTFKHKVSENQRKLFLDRELNVPLEIERHSVICRLKLEGVGNIDTACFKVSKPTLQFVSATDHALQSVESNMEELLRKKVETIDIFGIVLSFELSTGK